MYIVKDLNNFVLLLIHPFLYREVKLKFPFLSQVGSIKNKMGQEAMGYTVYKTYLLVLVEQLQ